MNLTRPDDVLRYVGRAVALLMLVGLVSSTVVQAEPPTVADELTRAFKFYTDSEFEKGIDLARGLLNRTDLSTPDSVAVYEALGLLTYARGKQYLKDAFQYLEKISQMGPCQVPLPREKWPTELRDRWYELLKTASQMSCGATSAESGIKTVAIMEFDNFSTGKYQEELGAIGKGLADMFQHDFAKISSFKVVERDKINFVLREYELVQSGAVDQATAVQAGHILGAHYMIFGSFTQLTDKQTVMVVRVVNVETSEIVASVDKEGKPEYFRLEKELVSDLADKMGVKIDEATKSQIEQGGTESPTATSYYAKGLEYMDRYDYTNAYEYFKKAYDADPQFAEAKLKMDVYEPLVG